MAKEKGAERAQLIVREFSPHPILKDMIILSA
jgi:hypothetical protein